MRHAGYGTRYLGWWHYQRRVPARFTCVDERWLIQIALRTQSLEVAMMRRDALADADVILWNAWALEFVRDDYQRSV